MRFLLALLVLFGVSFSFASGEKGLVCRDVSVLMRNLYMSHPAINLDRPLTESVYKEENFRKSLEAFMSQMDKNKISYVAEEDWEVLIRSWAAVFYNASQLSDCSALEGFQESIYSSMLAQKESLDKSKSFDGVHTTYKGLIDEIKSLRDKLDDMSADEVKEYLEKFEGFPTSPEMQDEKIKLQIARNWNYVDDKDSEVSDEEEFAFSVVKVMNEFATPMKVDDGGLTAAVQSFYSSFDIHTNYFSTKEMASFRKQLSADLSGVGAVIDLVPRGVLIVEIIKGGALDKSGVFKNGDIIFKIVDERGEYVFQNDITKNPADRITGKRGTKLTIYAFRGNKLIKTEINRDFIDGITGDRKYSEIYTSKNGKKIGVVTISSFSKGAIRSTTSRLKEALQDFNSQGVDGVIIDLRSNGGGSLDEVHKSMTLLLNRSNQVNGTISVGRRGTEGYAIDMESEDAGIYKGPLVILVNQFSASASEIMAGTLRAYNRAVVMGTDTTFGKGSVQIVGGAGGFLFPINGGVKMTQAFYYLPNGKSVQTVGVASDIIIDDSNFGKTEAKINPTMTKPDDIDNYISEDMKSMTDRSFSRMVERMKAFAVSASGINGKEKESISYEDTPQSKLVLEKAVNAFDGIK